MEQRARQIVYWLGMSKDIKATREGCANCNRNAPSQAATPPLPSPPPFEAGCVDVLSSTASTNLAGAAGLIRYLCSFFATLWVQDELSSYGGPEFTAGNTKDFLHRWGIRELGKQS